MRHFLSFMLVLGLCWAICGASFAQTTDLKSVTADMRNGGYVIVMRHGATNRDMADTDPLNHANVSQQRLLSAKGREVAAEVGGALKKLGIPVGTAFTSKFNRAEETGKLVAGHGVTTNIDITEGGLVVTPIENDRRAEAMRKLAATMPPRGQNTLVVSHKPNIIDAFGKDWFEVKEGEASVFRPDGAGKYTVVARLQASDWAKLAERK